jgi:hypothetical protein
METVRIELGGDFAVVFKELKHKTSSALQKLLRDSMKAEQYTTLQQNLLQIPDIEARKKLLSQIFVEGDDLITILNQVESWSFGPVTQDTIDNMSETKYQELLAEVNRLYSQPPLAVSK